MVAKRSSGVVLYRVREGAVEVLLGHMGGPFWARKDAGAWTIPKGEYEPDEDPLDAARREFVEELGVPAPVGDYLDLGEFAQSSKKTVRAFAVEGDLDPALCVSNTFEMEWPPKSGQVHEFPELDRAAWFTVDESRRRVVTGQIAVLDALSDLVG
jgi:predicted NUDIX family NTP pyrophosphohydrolase